MLSIHPNARTTPAVRAEIARSREPTGVLAGRFGVSTETVRKWRKRGPGDCLDRSARPHKLPWKASEEERAVVCELRRATRFPLDDLTFVVRHSLPHLGRDNVYRILKAAGLSRFSAANVRGGGGDSGSEAARRSDPHGSGAGPPPPRGSGGHRAFRLGWSCDASSWWRTDDRGQTATGRAAAEGRRRGFPADRRRGGAAAADGERRGGPDRGRALRAQRG